MLHTGEFKLRGMPFVCEEIIGQYIGSNTCSNIIIIIIKGHNYFYWLIMAHSVI